ncbi:Na+/H+ antiporter subunit G [Thermochromatium tepidum]|uniref:Na+/H+ antiporter subunit G n=1 Tax=Thermochromatium tepidum ATCC 43061 TaxID=316276 RepID=A0A6I6EEC7_THETI|nr:Na+/H+ antiporter subunit G [Thermochromatium tepidum]QGU33626.1 Na+/H+ antiporter subunit G [Thermochromatium tepidum ATCC 43061]
MLEIALALLVLIGAGFTFIGSLGLVRMPDFFTRLHGPTKATTLGVGSLLIASMLHFSAQGQGLSLHEVLVTLFLFITAPVSAHLLSKAALHLRTRSLAEPPPLIDSADQVALTSDAPLPHPSPAPRPSAHPPP